MFSFEAFFKLWSNYQGCNLKHQENNYVGRSGDFGRRGFIILAGTTFLNWGLVTDGTSSMQRHPVRYDPPIYISLKTHSSCSEPIATSHLLGLLSDVSLLTSKQSYQTTIITTMPNIPKLIVGEYCWVIVLGRKFGTFRYKEAGTSRLLRQAYLTTGKFLSS